MLLDAKQIIYPAQVIPEPVSTAPCLPMSLLRRRCRPALRRRRCRPGGRGRRQYHEPARSVRIALGVRWRESRRYQTPQCPSGSAQPAATKWTCALHWHSEDPLPVFMVASRSVRILSTHKATHPPLLCLSRSVRILYPMYCIAVSIALFKHCSQSTS